MQIGTKFSVSIHILLCTVFFANSRKVTSDFLAESVKTNPVVIRKLMGLLKEAGIITIAAGTGGIHLTKKPADITFLDVFRAVESVKPGLFKIHSGNTECPVARNIGSVLERYLSGAQSALEEKLRSYTVQDIVTALIPQGNGAIQDANLPVCS